MDIVVMMMMIQSMYLYRASMSDEDADSFLFLSPVLTEQLWLMCFLPLTLVDRWQMMVDFFFNEHLQSASTTHTESECDMRHDSIFHTIAKNSRLK